MPYSNPYSPDLPVVSAGQGLKTNFGITLLPPGSRVAAYVRSTGFQSGDDPYIAANLKATLAAGLAQVRAGLGDTVVVLPGHSESVTDATTFSGSLVAGTRIIGFGRGGNMPVFRWTATAAQWAVSVADVTIQGLRLRLEGAAGVVKAINVTGADFGLFGCDIETSSGASNLATIGIEIGSGATRAEISGNRFRGVAAGVVTDVIKVVSTPDLVRVTDNEFFCAGTSATGLVHVTAVATNLYIARNTMSNLTASSVAAIGVDNVAATGTIADNYINVLSTGAHTSNTTGIFTGAGALVRCFQNFSANDPRTSGLLMPTVDT